MQQLEPASFLEWSRKTESKFQRGSCSTQKCFFCWKYFILFMFFCNILFLYTLKKIISIRACFEAYDKLLNIFWFTLSLIRIFCLCSKIAQWDYCTILVEKWMREEEWIFSIFRYFKSWGGGNRFFCVRKTKGFSWQIQNCETNSLHNSKHIAKLTTKIVKTTYFSSL